MMRRRLAGERVAASLRLRLDELLSIRRFTLNLVGFNILNYLTRNVDYLLIGRYLGAQRILAITRSPTISSCFRCNADVLDRQG